MSFFIDRLGQFGQHILRSQVPRERLERIGLEAVYAIIAFGFGAHQAGLSQSGQVVRNRRRSQGKKYGQLLSGVGGLREQPEDLEPVFVCQGFESPE